MASDTVCLTSILIGRHCRGLLEDGQECREMLSSGYDVVPLRNSLPQRLSTHHLTMKVSIPTGKHELSSAGYKKKEEEKDEEEKEGRRQRAGRGKQEVGRECGYGEVSAEV